MTHILVPSDQTVPVQSNHGTHISHEAGTKASDRKRGEDKKAIKVSEIGDWENERGVEENLATDLARQFLYRDD